MNFPRVFILFLILPGVSHAGELAAARSILTNWGLAYCINALSSEKQINNEAQRTMGAYFQRGTHDDENAYDEVRKYIMQQLPKNRLVDQNSGKVMPFVTCMDLIQTPGFHRLVIKQDKYVQVARKEQ